MLSDKRRVAIQSRWARTKTNNADTSGGVASGVGRPVALPGDDTHFPVKGLSDDESVVIAEDAIASDLGGTKGSYAYELELLAQMTRMTRMNSTVRGPPNPWVLLASTAIRICRKWKLLKSPT